MLIAQMTIEEKVSMLEHDDRQAELIEAVAAANPNTIVVLNTGNAVTMDGWAPKVKAIVQ